LDPEDAGSSVDAGSAGAGSVAGSSAVSARATGRHENSADRRERCSMNLDIIMMQINQIPNEGKIAAAVVVAILILAFFINRSKGW
jgi:hypothetical protein